MRLFQQVTPDVTPVVTPEATPTPTAQPQQPAPPGTEQSLELAAVLALVIYLIFFGWLGYRRGLERERITLGVSLGLFFALQLFGERLVGIADKFGKGWAFLLGQDIPAQSALGLWAAENQTTFLISIWLVSVLVTYLITQQMVRKSKSDGWAVLAGIANGLVFATLFAPLLTSMIFPESARPGQVNHLLILGFVRNIWEQSGDVLGSMWELIEPNGTTFFFAVLIAVVLFAAITLRSSVKSKS